MPRAAAPSAAIRGCVRPVAREEADRRSANITHNSTHPWRGRPTDRPRKGVPGLAARTTMASSVIRFVSGVGFANGARAVRVEKAPPSVLRFLMNSRAATGPMAGAAWRHPPCRSYPRPPAGAGRSGTGLTLRGVPCQTDTRSRPPAEHRQENQVQARTRSSPEVPQQPAPWPWPWPPWRPGPGGAGQRAGRRDRVHPRAGPRADPAAGELLGGSGAGPALGLPVSLVGSLVLVWQGTPLNVSPYRSVPLLQAAVDI